MKNKNKSKDTHYIYCQTIGEHYILSVDKSPNSNVFVNIYDDPKNDDSFSIAYGTQSTQKGEIFTVRIQM
jgi:Ni,Fe-hydrogenase III component G